MTQGFGYVARVWSSPPKRKVLQTTSVTHKSGSWRHIIDFWRAVAKKHGGKVEAAWIESFVAVFPDEMSNISESRREVILTDQLFGKPAPSLPVRALYISKATGKPAITHTKKEEWQEMQPVVTAIRAALDISGKSISQLAS